MGLGGVVALGAFVRILAAITTPGPAFYSDATYYRLQGQLIVDGHGFADPFVWVGHHRLVATAFHPPLGSVVLAGVDWLGLQSVTAARVGMGLVGLITILFVGLLARDLRNERTGLIAAGLAALTPNLWVPDQNLFSEGLAAACVALGLWAAYRLLRTAQWRYAILLGGAIGLASLARPETLAFTVILVVPLALRLPASMRRRTAIVLVSGITSLIVITPWTIRSMTLFDRPVLFSTNGQAVIGFANCPSTYRSEALGGWSPRCPEENDRLGIGTKLPKNADESVQAEHFAAQGTQYLRDHAGTFLKSVLWARIGKSWSLYRPFAVGEARFNEAKTPSEMTLGVIVLWGSLAFAVVGAVALRRKRSLPLWPLLAPLLVATAISVIAYGTPRFRVIAEPSIAVLAAIGIDVLIRALGRTGTPATPAS